MTDRPCRVEPLGANIDTVLDTVTAEYAERVVQVGQALIGCSIATVREETVSLQQARGANELVRIPPERRAGSGATGAEYALIQTVKLFAVFLGLQPFLCGRRLVVDEEGGESEPFSTLVDGWGYWSLNLPVEDCDRVQLKLEVVGRQGGESELVQSACDVRPVATIVLMQGGAVEIFIPMILRQSP